MRDGQIGAVHANAHLQNPAREALLDAVQAITCRGLRHSRQEEIRIFEQRAAKRPAAVEHFVDERFARNADGLPGRLNDDVKRIGESTQHQRDADHPFTPDQTDFDGLAGLDVNQARKHAAKRKIHVVERGVGLDEFAALHEGNGFAVGRNAPAFVFGENPEEQVFSHMADSNVPHMRTFASDNNARAAAEIVQALVAANDGDAISYGEDAWTERARQAFEDVFGPGIGVYFAFNGTGANVVGLSCLLHPHEAVITPASSHLQTDECGAFERFTGSKVLAVSARDGKIGVDDLRPFAGAPHDEHHVVPRVVSISQSTEFGTLYTPGELRGICDFAHEQGWYVHLDGARICNAAAALDMDLRACTRDLGIDVLSFGGTKNGLLFGEAIVFFNDSLSGGRAKFARKQGMQLASKMRFIAAQFSALLEHDRWRTYARHANEMTQRLRQALLGGGFNGISRPVECNAIFARLPRESIARLQAKYFFYVFDDAACEARWMTHHATQAHDVDAFAAAILAETTAPRAAGAPAD